MSSKTLPSLERGVCARLDRLHELFGRDQSLLDMLDGLITRLAAARQLYGPGRSLAMVVSGIYSQLDELRHLYGSDSAEDMLALVIARKKRLNRLVELQTKALATDDENQEIEYLIKQYIYELVKEQAQTRKKNGKNGKAKSGLATTRGLQQNRKIMTSAPRTI
jgi:hypothetical protein